MHARKYVYVHANEQFYRVLEHEHLIATLTFLC